MEFGLISGQSPVYGPHFTINSRDISKESNHFDLLTSDSSVISYGLHENLNHKDSVSRFKRQQNHQKCPISVTKSNYYKNNHKKIPSSVSKSIYFKGNHQKCLPPSKNYSHCKNNQKIPSSLIKCNYCQNDHQEHLVKCISDECHLYFCNNIPIKKSQMSHIIAHLKESKHNIIEIVKKSKSLFHDLKCEFCENRNIFSLGFWKGNIICRVPCLVSMNDEKTENFQPLIQEEKLTRKLFSTDSQQSKKNREKQDFHEISLKVIKRIENTDFDSMINKKNLLRIRKVYQSCSQYSKIFKFLISLESAEEAIKNGRLFYNNVQLYFGEDDEDLIENKKINEKYENLVKNQKIREKGFFFGFEIGCKFTERDDIKVISKSGWDSKAKLVGKESGLFILEFEVPAPKHIKEVDMFLENKNGCEEKLINALKTFENSNNYSKIQKIILGHKVQYETCVDLNIKDFTVGGKFRLNQSQIEAIEISLKNHVSIIHGPPGTGKTNTIVALVYHIENLCRPNMIEYEDDFFEKATQCTESDDNPYDIKDSSYFSKFSKILVCAPSNFPVFDLQEKLTKNGLKTIQVLARSKEDEYKSKPGTLRYLTDLELRNNPEYIKLEKKLKIEKSKGQTSNSKVEHIQKKMNKIKYSCEEQILNRFNIICCTCTTTANFLFSNMNFEFVIVDEATQALEPEIIMCLIKKTKHLVLVGDKYQLGSMVSSETAKDLGLDISMIERFEDISIPYKMLNVQYRMDPLISKFSNETFYNNQIKNFHSSRVYKSFTFPSPVKGTTFFYNIGSLEEYSGSGGSYVNRYEAQSILSIIKYMKENQVPADEIGVITFYDGQKGFLINFLQKNLDKEYADGVEIMSVDASQGREKGFIILSCVRSNERLGVGFLSEFRRLNVAMTRAKYGLVVCGNAKTLLANELWNCLVQFFNDLGLVYGGPLECLKQEKMKIRKVKRFIFNRQYKYDD